MICIKPGSTDEHDVILREIVSHLSIADKLRECRNYDRETNLRGRLLVAERNVYLLKEELRWQHRQITNNPAKARARAELIKQKLGIT